MGGKQTMLAKQRKAAPRARPMRKAERRLQLLEVARDIIEQDGISALTMTALTERSGAARPIVYEHFGNSEAVAIALLEIYVEGSSKYVFERLAHAETIEQFMGITIDALFEYNLQNRLIVRKIVHGFVSGSRANEVYARHHKATVEGYVEMLRYLGTPKKVAEVAGFALHETVHSCIAEYATQPNNTIARETLKRMVIGLIRSVAPDNDALKPRIPSKMLRYLEHRSEFRKTPAMKS